MYTDGLSEARPQSRTTNDYASMRLNSFLGELGPLGPRELIDALHEDVVQFCAPDPPHDDCTIIAAKYLSQ